MVDYQFWEELWRREREFMHAGKKDLRHGISSVGVSSLAGQFYCEYKIENEFLHGEIPSYAKDEGTILHDELIPQEPISKEGFAELVSQKKPSYAVLRVWGKIGDIRMIGMPDHIIWIEEKPRWLVELKTTSGDPATLWDDQRAQVLIYGALLAQMGFDCSDLQLAVVRLKASDLSDKEKRDWVMRVSKYLEYDRIRALEAKNAGRMKVHVIKHDVSEAETCIRRMQDYWLGRREPSSSTSINKCKACEYRSLCSKSLYNP
jgi:PD-(D/E)XK nuclease superfamily protein